MATVLQAELSSVDQEDREKSSRFYRPELDALRFMAFLLVLCCHSLHGMAKSSMAADFLQHVAVGGAFGVDLFFALSAYLITELLRREKLATGSVDIRGFYMRRILRIWPLYFGFLVFWFVARGFTPTVFPNRAFLAFAIFCGNWYMAGRELGSPFQSPVTPFWSISVEEQFYLVWPVVVRYANKAALTAFACSLMAASCLAQFLFFRAGAPRVVVWVNSWVHGVSIGIGILSAVLLEGRTPGIHRYLRVAMVFGGLALFGISDSRFDFGAQYVSLWNGMAAYGCGSLGVSLLFYAFLGAPRNGIGFLTGRAMLYLGRISYGLYVFHVAALDLVKYLFLRYTGSCSPWMRFAVALPITLALAAASYRWYESPFLALKRRFTYIASGAR